MFTIIHITNTLFFFNRFIVIQGYEATSSAECSVMEGEIVTVDDVTTDEHWCYVTSSESGGEGWTPKEYLKRKINMIFN